MAYSAELEARIRAALGPDSPIAARRMFGGIAFLDRGHMCFGIVKDDLMVRVGRAGHAEALSQPGARPMDFAGRPMVGMVYVAPDAIAADDDLQRWLDAGLAFTRSLAPKPG